MMNDAAIAEFKAGMRGELIEPGDAGYEEAAQKFTTR